jgi:PAS domain S-box-containing protein
MFCKKKEILMLQEQRSHKESQVLRERIRALFQRGTEAAHPNILLWQAFDELATALKALERAEARADACEEQRLIDMQALSVSTEHYRALFEDAPAGYMITSLDGTIREVNHPAAALLHAVEHQLIGRALTFFLPNGARRDFQRHIRLLRNAERVQSWQQCFKTWDQQAIEVMVNVRMARGKSGQPQALNWLLYALPEDPLPLDCCITLNEPHASVRVISLNDGQR